MAKLPNAKARGTIGSWYAEVEGERLPCVHDYHAKRLQYDDDGFVEGEPPWPEFVNAIRAAGKVILTKSIPPDREKGQTGFQRKGYIAVFSMTELQAEEGHLRFRMDKRLIDLD